MLPFSAIMGLFITIEGIEGAGKSTLQRKLGEYISSLGFECVLTQEPGATELGGIIRKVLLDSSGPKPVPRAELLLFAADRAQHIAEVIRPGLQQQGVVLSDRYVHSTLAYQGFGRGIKQELLLELHSIVADNLMPDLVLLLDLDPEEGLKRARSRGEDDWNRFEEEDRLFHKNVRRGFLKLAEADPSRFVVLNATENEKSLFEKASREVKKLLES